MTEGWKNSIDNREAIAAVAVDLSKAFDAINHRLLLEKLKSIKIVGVSLDWHLLIS